MNITTNTMLPATNTFMIVMGSAASASALFLASP